MEAILSVANKFCCWSKYCPLTIRELITTKMNSCQVEHFSLVGLGQGILFLPINCPPLPSQSPASSAPFPFHSNSPTLTPALLLGGRPDNCTHGRCQPADCSPHQHVCHGKGLPPSLDRLDFRILVLFVRNSGGG